MPPAVRRLRTWSAPAELAAEIARAVKVRGGEILYAAGASTQRCHQCGHIARPPEQDRADLIWRCLNCGSVWDQNENAAKNILAAMLDASAEAPSLAEKQNKGLRGPRMTRKASRRKLVEKGLTDEAEWHTR